MRWEDERYVRLYTRDTVDWLALSLEAQGLLSLILRKVDRAGLLALGKRGGQSVAAILCHSDRWATVGPALDELLADGCVRIQGDILVVPNFIAAQEATMSPALRNREWRERKKLETLSDTKRPATKTRRHATKTKRHKARETKRHQSETDSTSCETRSTSCETPYLAVPSVPSEPNEEEEASPSATPTAPADEYAVEPDSPEEAAEKAANAAAHFFRNSVHNTQHNLRRIYGEVRGEKYVHGGAKDTLAVKRLLKIATAAEVIARWRHALALGSKWPGCSTFAQLASKWNDLAAPANGSAAPVSDFSNVADGQAAFGDGP